MPSSPRSEPTKIHLGARHLKRKASALIWLETWSKGLANNTILKFKLAAWHGGLETAGSQKDRLQGLAKGRPGHMLPGGRPIASTPTIRGCSSPHEERKGPGERPGRWSCCRPSTWKGEAQGKMFPMTSRQYFPCPRLQGTF